MTILFKILLNLNTIFFFKIIIFKYCLKIYKILKQKIDVKKDIKSKKIILFYL